MGDDGWDVADPGLTTNSNAPRGTRRPRGPGSRRLAVGSAAVCHRRAADAGSVRAACWRTMPARSRRAAGRSRSRQQAIDVIAARVADDARPLAPTLAVADEAQHHRSTHSPHTLSPIPSSIQHLKTHTQPPPHHPPTPPKTHTKRSPGAFARRAARMPAVCSPNAPTMPAFARTPRADDAAAQLAAPTPARDRRRRAVSRGRDRRDCGARAPDAAVPRRPTPSPRTRTGP